MCTVLLLPGVNPIAVKYMAFSSTSSLWRWNWHKVPKRRPTTIWRRGNTQKNIYNIQITAKVWNLEYGFLVYHIILYSFGSIFYNCIYGCMFYTLLFNFINNVFLLLCLCIPIVMFMCFYCCVCSVLCILFHCVVLCFVCV